MVKLPRLVVCEKHGTQGIGLVCRHLLASTQAKGFFWSDDEDQARPDAWCNDCEEKLLKDEFTEAWYEQAGFQPLCAVCWDEAKAHAESIEPKE
ncbi:MAG: hypothetical protein ABIP02_08060 [Arenimonas sp.]